MGIRKSQYHFRWDWGPELMCMGPDRPIHLRMWKERLGEVRTAARVDEGLRRSLRVDVDVEGAGTVGGKWRVVLKGGDEQVIRQEETSGPVEWELGEEVWLWWPVGHGAQLRYTVTVELLGEVSMLS
jgi:beta-mannosidase